MPRIPVLDETPAMSPNSPVPISSSEDARTAGESIAAFGHAGVNFGEAVAELQSKQAAIKRTFDIQEAKNKAESSALDIADQVRKTGAPDGSDWVQKFRDKYRESAQTLSDGVEDPVLAQGIRSNALDVENQYVGQLMNQSMEAFKTSSEYRLNNGVNSFGAQVFNNPDSFQEKRLQLSEFLTAQKDVVPGDRTKYEQSSVADLADSAISGRLARHDYSGARADLLTKFTPLFNAEKIQKLQDRIDEHQRTYLNTVYTQETRADAIAKRNQEAQREVTLSGLQLAAFNAKTPGTQMAVMNAANQALVSRKIKVEDYHFIKAYLDGDAKNEDAFLKFQYYDQITSGADLNEIRDQVRRGVAAKRIKPETGDQLIKIIVDQQKSRASVPGFRDQVSAGKSIMNAHFGQNTFMTLLDPESAQLKAQAMEDFTNLYLYKQMAPADAAREVVKKYKGGMAAARIIPGVATSDQADPESIQKSLARLKVLHDAKKLTDEEYIDALRTGEERKRAYERDKWPIPNRNQ